MNWNETVEETIKIVVITLSVVAALAALVKWSIEKYFQKSEEVLRLREQITNQAINSIEKAMDKVGNDLVVLSNNMNDLEGHLIIFQTRLNDYDNKSNEILRSYITLTDEVRKKLKTFENLEMYEDGNVIVFRKKNH